LGHALKICRYVGNISLEASLPKCFLHLTDNFAIKLGHIIAIALFSILENEKAQQGKSENKEKQSLVRLIPVYFYLSVGEFVQTEVQR
jgi:hypothetical protein